jgi:hypothetical protein
LNALLVLSARPTTEQDIKEGNQQGSSPHLEQPIGTEYGQAADEQRSGSSDERSAGSSPGTGSQAQEEVSQQQGEQPQGGRFGEEALPGDHPYDPRPRSVPHRMTNASIMKKSCA